MASNHSLVLYDPQETSEEVKAAAGFLAGFSGRTREAYTLDLRQFIIWCDQHHLALFEVTRTHIELYARELEDLGRAPATIGRRLSTLAASTATRPRRASSSTHPRSTCGARASTTNPMPWASTATSSARSSSPPGCRRLVITRCARCWP